MKNRIRKIAFNNKLRSVLFYVCYVLMLVEVFFRHTDFLRPIAHGAYLYVAMPILIILCGINFIEAKKKGKIISAVLAAFGVATRLISKNNFVLMAALFICAFKDINFDQLLKISILSKLGLLIILALFYVNGLTDSGPVIQGDLVRHSMGFGNPNTFSTHILSIIIQTFYLHRDRFKVVDLLVLAGGIASIMCFTYSKTQIICALLAAGIFVVRKAVLSKKGFMRCITKMFLSWTFVAGAALSLSAIGAYMINPTSMQKLNNITSGRISSAATVIKQNSGITVLGKDVDRSIATDNTTRVFDNGYAYILLYYGVFSLIAFAMVYYIYSRKSIKKDGGQTAWVLAIYAISGIAEHFFIEIATNTFLLKYSELVYDDSKKGQNC